MFELADAERAISKTITRSSTVVRVSGGSRIGLRTEWLPVELLDGYELIMFAMNGWRLALLDIAAIGRPVLKAPPNRSGYGG